MHHATRRSGSWSHGWHNRPDQVNLLFHIAWFAGAVLCVVALVAVYTTLAVNAEAKRQDDVVSVPVIATAPDAFMRTLAAVAGPSVCAGNEVRLYQNGDEIFPPMLDAIAQARDSVHFSTYVYYAGRVPDQFASAFEAAARRGVTVRVVLDRNGAKKISPQRILDMRRAGCDVRWFRPMQWYDWKKYNRRTHRRLLVVDGEIGFTGGVGIADEWSGRGDGPTHWRDSHVRILGPVVHDLQAAFADNWNEATGQLLLGAQYFPALEPRGDTPVCIVESNPTNATSAAQRSIAALVAGASRSLSITNAYFVPTPPFVRALCAARARGVDVKIVVPGPFHNKPSVRRASRHTWNDLLEGGVELSEHQRTMVHAKVLVADDEITMVGSINFDPRSFALNAECAAVMLDRGLAASATAAFRTDLSNARRVTLDDVRARSLITRAIDAAAYWVRGQL